MPENPKNAVNFLLNGNTPTASEPSNNAISFLLNDSQPKNKQSFNEELDKQPIELESDPRYTLNPDKYETKFQSHFKDVVNSFWQGIDETQKSINDYDITNAELKIAKNNKLIASLREDDPNRQILINENDKEFLKIKNATEDKKANQKEIDDEYVSKKYKLNEALVQGQGSDAGLFDKIQYTYPGMIGSSSSLIIPTLAATFGTKAAATLATPFVGEVLAPYVALTSAAAAISYGRHLETKGEIGSQIQQNKEVLKQRYIDDVYNKTGEQITEDQIPQNVLDDIIIQANNGREEMYWQNMAESIPDLAGAMLFMPKMNMFPKITKSVDAAINANKLTRIGTGLGKIGLNYEKEKFEEGTQYAFGKRQESFALGTGEYQNEGFIKDLLTDSQDVLTSMNWSPLGEVRGSGRYADDKQFQTAEESGGALSFIMGGFKGMHDIAKDLNTYRKVNKELQDDGVFNVDDKYFKLKDQILQKHFEQGTTHHLLEGVKSLIGKKNEDGTEILTEQQAREEVDKVQKAYDTYETVNSQVNEIEKKGAFRLFDSAKQKEAKKAVKDNLFHTSLQLSREQNDLNSLVTKRTNTQNAINDPKLKDYNNISDLVEKQKDVITKLEAFNPMKVIPEAFNIPFRIKAQKAKLKELEAIKKAEEERLTEAGIDFKVEPLTIAEQDLNKQIIAKESLLEEQKDKYKELLKIKDDKSLQDWYSKYTKNKIEAKETADVADAKQKNTEETTEKPVTDFSGFEDSENPTDGENVTTSTEGETWYDNITNQDEFFERINEGVITEQFTPEEATEMVNDWKAKQKAKTAAPKTDWNKIIASVVSTNELDRIIDQIDVEGSMSESLLTSINKKRESLTKKDLTENEVTEKLSNGVTNAFDDNLNTDEVLESNNTSNETSNKEFVSKKPNALMMKFYEFLDKTKKWARHTSGELRGYVIGESQPGVSMEVNNPNVATEGSEVTYVHNGTDISLVDADGRVVGFMGLGTNKPGPTATLDVIEAHKNLLAIRAYVLSQPSGTVKTTVLVKGHGKLLTKMEGNLPILDQEISQRPEDMIEGRPLFLWDNGSRLVNNNLTEEQAKVAKLFENISFTNSEGIGEGRVYQVVKTANGSWFVIPVYTKVIGQTADAEKTINTIISILKGAIADGKTINYQKALQQLNKYIFATNTANYKSNVNTLRIYEDKEHVENGTISVGGFKLTFGDVLTGNKLVEFKAALGSVRHNISINELGTLEEDSRLIEGGILTTNAYTDPNGQYYVQPYIEVNDPQGYVKPEVKVEPIKATTTTNIAPVVDPKADIEKEIKETLRNIIYDNGTKPYDNPDVQDELEIDQASRNIANTLSKNQPLTFKFLKANQGAIFSTTNNNVIKISINKGTGDIELSELGTVRTIIVDKNDNISYDFENKGKKLNLKAARAISQAESKHKDKLKDIFKKYDKADAELKELEQQPTSNQSEIDAKIADIPLGKVGNTEYEVRTDGVYHQGKKLNNPENKTHSQLIEADIEKRRQEELLVPISLIKLPQYLAETIKKAVERLSVTQRYDIVKAAINGKTAQQIVSELNLIDENGRRDTEIVRQVRAYYGIPSLDAEDYKDWKISIDKINAKYDAELEAKKAYIERRRQEELIANIYAQLGDKTVSRNVILKSVYQQAGINFAKSIGGIFSLRVNNSNKHFGNPFSSVPSEIAKGLIATKSTKESVEKYIGWVLFSNEERAKWIREQIKSGNLKNKPIIYYKELGEPSHATALDYLINAKYDAEYVDKVKKGEFTAQQAKDALKEINRLTPELSKQLDDAELAALENTTATTKQEIVPPNQPRHDISNIKINDSDDWAESRTKLEGGEINQASLKALNKILPGLSVANAKLAEEVGKNMKDTYGMFHNMLIYLFKGATNQTLFHEAFHGVFRNILSDTERKAVLDEAIKKYDKPDAARLQFLRDGKGNANLSDEILTQLHYEERLADDFGKHADGVFNPSLGQRILNFFNKIVDLFNVFRNANTDQINNLFEAVTKGKFATRSIVAKLANKAIDLNDFGGAYKRVLNTSDLEIPNSVELERTNSIANQVLDGIAKELAKGVPMSKISISEITFKIREQYKLVFAIENAKSKDEFNPQLYKISYAVDLKFGEIFENVKKQIALTRKLHIKGDFIDTTEIEGAEDTATESENIDNMQGNESKGFQEQTVISGIRSATQDIKLFLSNIPVIDKDGVVQMDNFGFTLFHSYEKLYYKLESSLVGTTSFVEQMKIMKELAPFSNEIKQIIDAVEAITDPKVAANFKQQFAANFNKQVLNYKLITYSKKGTKYIFKMLNPNRKDVALNLKTQWTSTNITDPTNLATNDIRTFNQDQAVYEVSKNKVSALLDSYWAKGENTKGGKILTPVLTLDEVYELAQKLGIGISFDSIELYSSLEEANLVNLTKDLLDYGKYMYVENKFSPARNTLTKLINLETNAQTELFTSSFNNVENSVVYAVQHQSFASKLVKALNSKEASSSALVKELERDPMNFGNIILANKNKLEMFALDGLKMQGDNITGKKFNQIHEDDYLAMVINMYDNPSAKGGNTTEETAVYAPIIPAEKGLSFGFTGVKIEVNKRDGKIPADSQIVKEFTQLFFNELSRIRQVMVDIKTLPENKLISNVHLGKKLGLKFNLPNAISPELKTKLDAFLEKTLNETIPTGVNPSEYVRGLLENTADKKTVELMSKVTESIISNLENIAQDHIELALNSDVIQEKDGVLTSDKIETTNVEKLITEWALNSTLFNVSQSMLINGDPAFYKGAEDNGKRFYQGFSMLKFADTSTIDKSYKYLKGGKMKINVIADVEEGTRSTQDLADIAKENNLPNVQKLANDHYNTKVDKDGKVKNPLNATDAQLFVSVGIYEELKRVFGISSEELSEGFSNADLANAMNSVPKSQQGILDIIKPFFYGVQWNEEYQRYIPIQVKCSIFPLTNKYVANNPLLAEHKALMDADENYPQVMAFHSSMKAFLPSKADILTPNKTSIVELDLNNFGEQVANPDHMLDSHNSSLRQMKMLMYGMVAEVDAQGNDLMYGDKTGRQIKDEIAMLDKANIEEALGKVVEAFEGNNKEFNEFIQNAITSRNSTSIIEAVFEQKPDGSFSYPLDLINSKATIQLISSIFSKRVVRQEFKGGAAVQVSSVGLQIAPKESDYKNAKAFQEAVDASPELTKLQTSLSWIRKGDVDANGKVSSIDYIEAYAPAHAKEFINKDGSFKDNIPEELRQMLIYRIPYEGAHSSMVIKVIGFLPIEYKGAMLLPYEVTQQFGADFDFDKIYFIVKDFTMSKDGKFSIYKYNSKISKEDNLRRYLTNFNYLLKTKKNDIQFIYDSYELKIKTIKNSLKILKNEKIEESIYNVLDTLYAELASYTKLKNETTEGETFGEINEKIKEINQKITDFQNDKGLENSYFKDLNYLKKQLQVINSEINQDIFDYFIENDILKTLSEFSKLPIVEQNIKPARDNKILDNYMQILRSVNMLESLITPSGPGAIADIYENVEENEDHGNYFTPGHQVYLKALFHKISMLKGVSALQVTGHAWATEGNLVIKPVTVKIDGVVTVVERGVKVFKKNAEGKNEVELKNNLSKIMSDTGSKIVEEISSLMAVILDAVKTPNQLPSIGISIKTLPMWSYLVRLGFGSKVASQFTSQQAIKDLSAALENNDKQLKSKDFIKQDVNTVKAEYVQKYQAAHEALYAEHKPKEGTSYDSRKIVEFLEKNDPEKIAYYNTLSLENLEKYSTLSPEELAKKKAKQPYTSISKTNANRTGIDKLKYLQSQIVALNVFKESEDVIKELGRLNQLFSVNKETGPNFEDVNGKKASYDSLVKDDTVIAGIGQLLNSDVIKPYTDTVNAQFEIMAKHYNFASPFFNNIKDYLAKLQYGDNADLTRIPAEDREVINGFIQMFLDAEETFSDIYEDENRISEEDFLNDLRVLLAKKISTTYKYKIFGNKELSAKAQEQLKATTLLKSLEVVSIKNSNQSYVALKGNRYELAQKEMMIDEIVRLYNSKYKAFATRLIKQAFQDNGFFSGLHSYSGLIHPSVLQDMGLVEGRAKIRKMVKAESTNKGRMDRIIDQLVRNNAKKFTRVYDNNQKLFTEIEGGKTIVVDMNSKDSRLKSELVRSSETNKHPRYIRYTLNDLFTPIYKLDEEATEESGQITYRQVSYLGSPAKKIEINPFSDEVETKFPNNKYEKFVVKDKTGLFGGKSEKELAAEFGEDETTPVPEAPEVETESNTENIIDGQAEVEPEGKLKSAEDLTNEWGDDEETEETSTNISPSQEKSVSSTIINPEITQNKPEGLPGIDRSNKDCNS